MTISSLVLFFLIGHNLCHVAGRRKKIPKETQLGGFKLIDDFRAIFGPLDDRRTKSSRELDPRRKFDAEGYFVMMLFALLNPVIDSMRGLCASSKFERFQSNTGLPPVSLGSFSEAQSVFDPEVLRGVIRTLMQQVAINPPASLRGKLNGRAVEAIDSTIWEVLPRMGWAHWRDQFSTRQNAVRLHLRWRLFTPGCGGAHVGPAKECERRVLHHELLEPDIIYVGDRNYAGDYALLERIEELNSSFVVRLQDMSVFEELEKLPVSAAERAKGITHHVRVALGHRNPVDRGWRLVRLIPPGKSEAITILTNLKSIDLGAWETCEIYRQRWTIELFFRWLKCALPCRHWLAESPQGVTMQVYCSLIAALLLSGRSGKLPNKRQMEAIRYWTMGWISDEELASVLNAKKKKA